MGDEIVGCHCPCHQHVGMSHGVGGTMPASCCVNAIWSERTDLHDGCRRVIEATETALSTTEAALAESRGEVERLTKALKEAAEYGCDDAERHGMDWTTCRERHPNAPGRWCSCCIARNAVYPLEAPHEST